MMDFVVSAYIPRQHLQALVCIMKYTVKYTVNPFKCLLIRPSTPFPLSRSVLFHSTPNYVNPLIAQRVHRGTYCWGDECVLKCGHISHHLGLITGPSAPGVLQLGPAMGSAGVILPKIRCQGIFYAPVSIPTRLPDFLLVLLGGLEQNIIY